MRYGLSALMLTLVAITVHGQNVKSKYPPLPEAFSSFGAAVADGYVYVYGGHVGKTHTYSTEAVTGKFRRLNLSKPGVWEELPADVAIQGLALVAHGGKVYRIGGMQPRNKPGEDADSISVPTVARFDPKIGKWETLPALPRGRSSHDATVVGDKIVVIGGWEMHGQGKKNVWHDTTVMLDLSKAPLKWESMPQPFQRRALNVAAVNGKVYVVGGMGPDGTDKCVDVLDLSKREWTQGPTLPGPARNGFTPAVCTSAGKVYASPQDGKLYRLSQKSDAWQEVGVLETKRLVHRIVPMGDRGVLALGGASRDGNVAQVEAIVASDP